MIDYLIVGSGIAGCSFAAWCSQNEKSFLVFDDDSQPSSKIAGGLYNPVVLKRFSEVWKAKEQLDVAIPFYADLAEKLNIKIDYKIPIYRKLASIEEQNNWFAAADKHNLADFLSTDLIPNKYPSVNAPLGYGEVFKTGYLDVKHFVVAYSSYLEKRNLIRRTTFHYDKIEFFEDHISYQGITYKNIIFAEGFGLHANPFFNDLPLDGTKGELLLIKAPNLNLDVTIKSSVFILPIGNDLYKVGATYDWKDKTNMPTQEGLKELKQNLEEVISCEYEVIDHFAGVRPTVKDRRPLVGTHFKYKNLHVLNGLGTRGVMLAPFLVNQLFNYIENGIPLDQEIDIARIYKKRKLFY